MTDPIRVDLTDALDGHHVLIDPDGITFGLLEDLQGGQITGLLDGLTSCIVGGDLPSGTDRAGLRKLTPPKMTALVNGVVAAASIPKS